MDLSRVERDWRKVAKENVEVEKIKGAIYGFGSELATLRLFYEYRYSFALGKVNCGYSDNLRTHYFVLETNL